MGEVVFAKHYRPRVVGGERVCVTVNEIGRCRVPQFEITGISSSQASNDPQRRVCVCVRACARTCVRACVRACMMSRSGHGFVCLCLCA